MEHADSDATMCCVAKDLLEQFDIKKRDGWVMLVGNGKAYRTLSSNTKLPYKN